jgi:hypothetical protein
VLSFARRVADPRAISIHPVEARRAAWIRSLAGQNPDERKPFGHAAC